MSQLLTRKFVSLTPKIEGDPLDWGLIANQDGVVWNFLRGV